MKTERAIANISSVAGIFLIVLVLFLMVPAILPRIMGYQTYNVISGSMEPELSVGCLVLVKPISPETVKEDDIIVFHRGDSIITHRVVEVQTEEQQFITKGDANESRDASPVPYQELVGIVTHHYAVLGRLMGFLSSVPGKILLIGFIIVGVTLQFLAGKLRR